MRRSWCAHGSEVVADRGDRIARAARMFCAGDAASAGAGPPQPAADGEHRPADPAAGVRPRGAVALGAYGRDAAGSIETHQYSVTSHKRHLAGGNDEQDGHKERLHARGGIPGVFFSYVSSPLLQYTPPIT